MRTTPFFMTLFLASCSPSEDSPSGFTDRTGIPLCKEAHVKRTNSNDPARTSGFTEVYLFRVEMSDQCAEDFWRELQVASNEKCKVRDSCHVMSRRGASIGAKKMTGYYEIVSVD